MNNLDIENLVLLATIIYAWLMRRKGLVAVQKLSQENRKAFFKGFGVWRWRHYGVLALLILLPGLMLWKPDLNPSVLWALAVSEFIVVACWFSVGYHIMQDKLNTIINDPDFIKAYFADRFPMGLLYIIFTFIALQKVNLLPHY